MIPPAAGRRFYTSADRHYLPGLLALCRSFRAFNSADELVVVRMPSSGFSPPDLELLESVGTRVVDADIAGILSIVQRAIPAAASKYGLETYAKMALTETEDGPFYWIDADTVVASAIDPSSSGGRGALVAGSPWSAPLAAHFRDPHDLRLLSRLRMSGDPMAMLERAPSVNCGLMWLDPIGLRAWGFLDAVREILQTVPDQLTGADESIFNLLSGELGLHFFPDHAQRYVDSSSSVERQGSAVPWVVHFTGRDKPWKVGPAHPGWTDYHRWES